MKGRPSGLRARLRGDRIFYFPNPFLFCFQNQIQLWTKCKSKYSFKYTFLDENFWEISKTELLQTFENSFIFQFSFSFFSFTSKPFLIYFQKQFKQFWILIQTTQAINQMHRHVCTTMLLLLMMNFNIMKNILFPIFHEYKMQ